MGVGKFDWASLVLGTLLSWFFTLWAACWVALARVKMQGLETAPVRIFCNFNSISILQIILCEPLALLCDRRMMGTIDH